MEYKVYYGIKHGYPSILDINTNGYTWPYVTSGHFINTSGFDYRSDGYCRVRITDPYGPGLENNWYYAGTLYNVNNNHWRKAIIW